MIPSVEQAVSIVSNIRDGENPEYTIATFRAVMPAFTEEIIPDEQLQVYIDMAQAVVKEARWHSLWREGMRLYIAHFATLYLGTPHEGSSAAQIVNAARVQGEVANKSVDRVSVSYATGHASGDLTGWAAWKLTTYGTQYATLARMVSKGGMYVR